MAQRPAAGTDNARLLDALLESYPHAVWAPNGRLKLMAHSRAADLRKLGWTVESVRRKNHATGRPEYGYVLQMQAASIAEARRATGTVRRVSFNDKLVHAADVAERCGLTLDQLRYLDRVGHVPFDVVSGKLPQYTADTVRLLQAVGLLVSHGLGLDTALAILRHHRDDLATAVRLATPEVAEGAA